MKLIFNRPFKSINKFDPIELSAFTVLTGVNGAGKSHLLQAIENGAVTIEGIPPNVPQGIQPIRRFDSNTLVPHDTGSFSAAQVSQEQTSLWAELMQHRDQQINQFKDQLRQFEVPELESLGIKEILSLGSDGLVTLGLSPERASQALATIEQTANNADQYIKSMFIRNDPHRIKLISTISGAANNSVFEMEDDDFFSRFPKLWQPVDLFQQSFARLFTAYQRLWFQNKMKATANSEGVDVSFLTEQEFIEKHGREPWEFLNEILSVAQLDFRINEPYKWDDRPYEPVLTDVKRGIKVKFNDLSSGERILMSFALCLYHANDPNSAADFPKLLLFDEIDAPLHPSMTRSLLRTIQLTLVEKHNIKVILTTHSPSTVALAPSDSIFVMSKQEDNRLRSTNKDAALGILTAGVPTLSVNYENRRQVFVESKYDVEYYSAMYELARAWLEPEVTLSFIASGISGNSNCDQVKTLVNQLADSGNRTVVGIVDWDRRNSSTSTILVIGEGERYSIENFVLDPIPLGLLMLREKFFKPDKIGLSPGAKYSDAPTLTQDQLQSLATAIVNKIAKLSTVNDTGNLITIKYIGGLIVDVPEWFLVLQGHALEALLKEAFPQLLRYRNEPELKLAVIKRVLDDFPQFIPESVVELFRNIQRIGTHSA